MGVDGSVCICVDMCLRVRWRVGIQVMTGYLIYLRSDVLRCFTTFYSVLVSLHTSTFVLLNCLAGLCIVKFEWSQKAFFLFCAFIKNNQVLLFVSLLASFLPSLFVCLFV